MDKAVAPESQSVRFIIPRVLRAEIEHEMARMGIRDFSEYVRRAIRTQVALDRASPAIVTEAA